MTDPIDRIRQNWCYLLMVPKRLRTDEMYRAAVLRDATALLHTPRSVDLSPIRPDEAAELADWEQVRRMAGRYGLLRKGWHGPKWDPSVPGMGGTEHSLAGWAQALSPDPELRRMWAVDAAVRILPRHAYLFFNTGLTGRSVRKIR